MGFYIRKRFKHGSVSVGKNGVGWSVGGKGFRVGHRANRSRKRSTKSEGHGCFWYLCLLVAAVFALMFVSAFVLVIFEEFWPQLLGLAAVIASICIAVFVIRKRSRRIEAEKKMLEHELELEQDNF